MSWWEEHVLPRLVDRTLDTGPVHRRRAQACAGLTGDVVEIGFGSGANIRHYPAEVRRVAAVEPSDTAWRLSEPARSGAGAVIERAGLDGQRLDSPDDSFDSALSTFTLCTIPDPAAALSELRRVLRPGGRLHLLEHGRAPDARVQRWQLRLDPVQRRVAGGCHLSRDHLAALTDAGFEVEESETGYLPGPGFLRPATYLYLLTARNPG